MSSKNSKSKLIFQELGDSKKTAEIDLAKITELKSLEEWKVKYLGRKSFLTNILRDIKNYDPKERPIIGSEANNIRKSLENSFENKNKELKQDEKKESHIFDYSLSGRIPNRGRLHPVTQTIREVCSAFSSLGFQIKEGPEVEWDLYNFDLLNIPKDHPARDMWDTLWIDNDEIDGKRMLLRTHTSPMQARIMEKSDPPIRVIVPGKCYRYEATDSTHEWHFNQIEGLAIDSNLNFTDLKGTLYDFARKLFGPKRKIRFRCDYFPFVEPGVDMSIDWQGNWIEILGAGMVHPKVLESVGYDSNKYSGFAFGVGVERIAMIRHGIDNIRHFYGNDMRFLSQF
ncbi:MAG: phenylalanine--tRNA ligase subunit alpha [Dehalococcoidia bacterium]|jgi:phenylalanyl-tRNA synthetase alpha chain|nr:phenylalanine--tRNA ligase subunit alpha [Dehalococcoidia bacterium]